MKTETNKEKKAKFFAQYWGQEVLRFNTVDLKSPNSRNAKLEIGSWIINNGYLLLKPLSSISDEDAIEIAKICYKGLKTGHLEAGKNLAKNIQKDYAILHVAEVLIFVVDYLRSKGYALPWMGLLVEEMVKAGWIKLIQ